MTGLEFLMSARAFAGERTHGPVATLTLARRIVNREPIDGATAERPFAASEQVYAHTTIAGHGAGFIEHVWTRDGVELARHYMPVGDALTELGFAQRSRRGRAREPSQGSA